MRKDFEDLSDYTLSHEEEEELLRTQDECTVIWGRKDGWPVGVTMTYIYRDGKIWLTTSGQHARVLALKRDDRCCVVVSSAGAGEIPMLAGSVPTMHKGKATTIRGRCRIMTDEPTKRWFFRAFSEAVFPGNRESQEGFAAMMDSPRRAIMCIVPEGRHLTWNVARLHAATGGAVGKEN
jgi:general stress protein 26